MTKKMDKKRFVAKLNEELESLHEIAVFNKEKNKTLIRILSFDKTFPFPLFTTYEEFKKIDDLIDLIQQYSNYNQVFSSIYLQTQIMTIINNTLDKKRDIQSEVDLFYVTLKDNSTNEWLIISEIEKATLKPTNSSFKLIECTIKYLSKDNIPINSYLEKSNLFNIENGIENPIIYTSVIAGDAQKAIELGFEKFNTSINLLRLYYPSCKPILKGGSFSAKCDFHIFNETTKKYVKETANVYGNYCSNCEITEENYNSLQINGINCLENDTPITKVIKDCLHWFGNGLNESIESAKIFNFVTVLESSLKKKGEKTELKQRVSDRCALLLGKDFEERKRIAYEISNIYDVRSTVVHTGAIVGDSNMAKLAQYYARNVLQELIKRNTEYKGNFDLFIEEIDNKKYMA